MELMETLRRAPPGTLLTEPAAMAPYLLDWRKLYQGQALCVARPRDTGEVARIVTARRRQPASPSSRRAGIRVSPAAAFRWRPATASCSLSSGWIEIRAIDAANYTMTVEAGCILQKVQEAAAAADRLFPLSLAAEGSCRIGGNLSTNAGGIAVLRYGNMRDLTLGLEVVLPDGRIWDGLRALRKDNTGYDLKQLFIGAEGTLGVITAAVLKLFPLPRQRVTVFAAAAICRRPCPCSRACGRRAAMPSPAIEMIPRVALALAMAHVPGSFDPFAQAP